MPTTVNGIGTRYVGKKNVENFPGVCQSCGRQGTLQNYETGLWFSALYIPLLPLGKKQILNYCTSCSRHNSLAWSEWEKLKEQAVRRDMEAMSQQPDDHAAALKFFTTLVAFRKQAEATDLASILQNRFGNHADVQMELGSWHESLGRMEQAEGCFRRALELDPQNLVAKRAVAFCLIRGGRLAEAIRILESPPPFTPGHDPSLYVMLARGFQDQHQHDEALQWFAQVLEAAPQAGHEKAFRKLVKTSERHTNQPASILPHIAFYRSGAFVATVAVLLIAALAGFGNYYIEHHRTLHVVNGFSVPVQVQMDGAAPITVSALGRHTLEVPEGHHEAVVSAAGKELRKAEFDISAGYFGRFFKKPVYVLNVAGSAMVVWEKTIYSKAAAPRAAGPGDFALHYGQDFVTYDDVDYAFQQFPQTLQVKGSGTVTKTRVDVMPMEPAQIFGAPPDASDPKRQLSFLEAHLQVLPDDRQLLRAYCEGCLRMDEAQRCREFLAARLTDRPVLVEWHRSYQHVCETTGKDRDLPEKYQKWLAEEPQNSALMYLVGRIEPESAQAMKFYDQALAADPENRYAWFAKGYQLELAGDFAAARDAVQKACDLAPHDEEMQSVLTGLQLATGDYGEVETKLRKVLSQQSLDLETYQMLQETLVLEGKGAETQQVQNTYNQAISATPLTTMPADDQQLLQILAQAELLYYEGKHQPMLDLLRTAPNPERLKNFVFRALLELGQIAEADQLRADTFQAGYSSLLISIGWEQQADHEQSKRWKEQAISELQLGSADDRRVAEMLKDTANARYEDALQLTMPRQVKMIALVALAQQTLAERGPLLDLAQKLNYRLTFPHNFLARAIISLREKK